MRILLEGGNETELSAIAAALRRGGCDLAQADDLYDFRLTLRRHAAPPALHLDVVRGRAIVDGRSVRLTRIELALLSYLAARDRPADRLQLLSAIWGYRFDPGTNLVAVHVSRLRAKIGANLLLGGPEGYRLSPNGGAGEAPRVDSPEAGP